MQRKLSADVEIGDVVFSTDGKLLRGICRDNKLRTWDVSSGTVRQTIAFDKGDRGAILTEHGCTTVGEDGALKAWDLTSGNASKRTPPSSELRPGGAILAANGDMFAFYGRAAVSVRRFDPSGKERYAVPSGIGGTAAVAISADGTKIAAATYDADVRAWKASNGELLRTIGELPVSMFALKFSPDGKWLAAGGADRQLYLYDAETWKQTRALSGQPEMISAIDVSSDGTLVATGGFSELTLKNPVKVLVWDVRSGKPVRTFDAAQRVGALAFGPDSRSLAVSTFSKTVDLWQWP